MTKLYIGFTDETAASNLSHELVWKKNPRDIKHMKITSRNPQTGECILSVETDSDEIIDFLKNSGGRILTNEQYEALTSVSKGDTGIDVQSLQRDLYNKGYYPSNPDFQPYDTHGARTFIFDEETELALKEFQRANGLPVTGIANEETIEKLRES